VENNLVKPGVDFKPISGKLVVLKPRDQSFLREYYVRRLRPDVLAWADVWPKNPTYEEVRLSFANQEESPKEWRLWIHSYASRLVGEVSLFDIDRTNKRAEFGICIFDPDYWGKGYGTEAGRLFLRDASQRFGLKLFYLFTAQANKRGIGSFEKIGFKITERLSMEGKQFVRMEATSVAISVDAQKT
jgi:RimJ/RimL family protein N-acetyltransferase